MQQHNSTHAKTAHMTRPRYFLNHEGGIPTVSQLSSIAPSTTEEKYSVTWQVQPPHHQRGINSCGCCVNILMEAVHR